MAYEIMQQRVIDGAWRFQSLDDVYYFGGQNAHNQRAMISHNAVWPNEFSFQRGDLRDHSSITLSSLGGVGVFERLHQANFCLILLGKLITWRGEGV